MDISLWLLIPVTSVLLYCMFVSFSLWLLVPLVSFIAYYTYMTWNNGVFKKMGVPGPKPTPFIGNVKLLLGKGFQFNDRKLHEEFGEAFGFFFGRFPSLQVNSISFAKQVLVKEFASFVDRTGIDISAKPMGRALTNLKGEDWKVVRNTLTPTFSAGKMKKMNKSINQCSDQLVENIQESVKGGTSFDFKELSGAFTMDVIARTGFGLEINSQRDKKNKFVEMAKLSMSQGLMSPFFIILFLFPFALNFLNRMGIAPSMPKKCQSFFIEVIEKTMQAREEDKQKSIDFLQLMMDAHKDEDVDGEETESMKHVHGKKKTLTTDDILANAMLFFLAGYETTANTLSFLGYLMATNPDCQDKLIEEIDAVLGDKEPTYEVLQQMPYLDQSVNETLRLYPQATRLSRYCKSPVTIDGIDIPEGMGISLPVYAFQTDPDVWPEPMKFDPTRFSPEEKAKRDPYYFMPFGNGPRNCIGMRLALMEMKMATAKILQNYRLTTCPETEMVIDDLRMKPKNGLFLKAEKR